MAANTSTNASNTPLVELNTATSLPIKLNSSNYPTWYKQITILLLANNIYGYVTGKIECPLTTIGTSSDAADNPAFLHWKHQDHYVFLALLGSCGPDAQIVMSSATSSVDVWKRLNKAYANCRSYTRIMSLKERLASITKGSSSVSVYLRSIRFIADELALIGHAVNDLNLVIAALNGLGPSFRAFSASIRTHNYPLSFGASVNKHRARPSQTQKLYNQL